MIFILVVFKKIFKILTFHNMLSSNLIFFTFVFFLKNSFLKFFLTHFLIFEIIIFSFIDFNNIYFEMILETFKNVVFNNEQKVNLLSEKFNEPININDAEAQKIEKETYNILDVSYIIFTLIGSLYLGYLFS